MASQLSNMFRRPSQAKIKKESDKQVTRGTAAETKHKRNKAKKAFIKPENGENLNNDEDNNNLQQGNENNNSSFAQINNSSSNNVNVNAQVLGSHVQNDGMSSKPNGMHEGNNYDVPINGPIITGVRKWEEHTDSTSTKIFFYNPETKVNSWGLPLRDTLSPETSAKVQADDWECHVDHMTYKRFYRSKNLNRVQWAVPIQYKQILNTFPYFSDAYANQCLKIRNQQHVKKTKTRQNKVQLTKANKYTARDLAKKIELIDVLENPITCAGFHRFCVAKLAEENILFFAAVEIFEKGEFHGQTILGEQLASSGNNENLTTSNSLTARLANSNRFSTNTTVDTTDREEGKQALYKQMRETRASIRMGLSSVQLNLFQFQSMKDRAKIIYEKFLKKNSELWVCVSDPKVSTIKKRIDNASELTNLFGVFNEAQSEVYENMVQALYLDFAKAVVEYTDHEIKGFPVDDVLRFAYIDLKSKKKSL